MTTACPKKFGFIASCVALAGVGMSGCGDPGGPHGLTLSFLVTAVEVSWDDIRSGGGSGRREAAGFDLDGIDSDGSGTGCTSAEDYESLSSYRSPPSGGVDNAMFGIFEPYLCRAAGDWECPLDRLNQELHDSIALGSYRLILEVAGIDSLESDPSVDVRSGLARTADCGDGGTGCALERDADGGIVPGQPLVMLRTEPETAIGRISSRHLHVTLPHLAGPIARPYSLRADWEYGQPVVPAESVVVDAEILPDPLGLHGMMGGTLRVYDVVEWDPESVPPPDPSFLTMGDFSPHPDDPTLCDRMSFGVTFEAIRVEVE